ncbi:hypothetical protein U1Q18_044725 [Sarracenia purpurea var. burkii]
MLECLLCVHILLLRCSSAAECSHTRLLPGSSASQLPGRHVVLCARPKRSASPFILVTGVDHELQTASVRPLSIDCQGVQPARSPKLCCNLQPTVVRAPPLTFTAISSFTLAALSSTLAPAAGRRHLNSNEPAGDAKKGLFSGQKSTLINIHGHLVPESKVYMLSSGNDTAIQKRGGKKKDVYCEAFITKTKSTTSTTTVQSVTTAARQTVTITSDVPATITSTVVPKDVSVNMVSFNQRDG